MVHDGLEITNPPPKKKKKKYIYICKIMAQVSSGPDMALQRLGLRVWVWV